MNPETTIRPWLIACNSEGGIGAVDFFDTAAPESDDLNIYFVYTVYAAVPNHERPIAKQKSAEGSYDATVSGAQEWTWNVKIEIFNSQNGLAELAGIAVAAEIDQDLKNLFKASGVKFKDVLTVKNKSTRDGNRFFYRHEMEVNFNALAKFTHVKRNYRVSAVSVDGAVDWTQE
jgi:hypothetical protein